MSQSTIIRACYTAGRQCKLLQLRLLALTRRFSRPSPSLATYFASTTLVPHVRRHHVAQVTKKPRRAVHGPDHLPVKLANTALNDRMVHGGPSKASCETLPFSSGRFRARVPDFRGTELAVCQLVGTVGPPRNSLSANSQTDSCDNLAN